MIIETGGSYSITSSLLASLDTVCATDDCDTSAAVCLGIDCTIGESFVCSEGCVSGALSGGTDCSGTGSLAVVVTETEELDCGTLSCTGNDELSVDIEDDTDLSELDEDDISDFMAFVAVSTGALLFPRSDALSAATITTTHPASANAAYFAIFPTFFISMTKPPIFDVITIIQ